VDLNSSAQEARVDGEIKNRLTKGQAPDAVSSWIQIRAHPNSGNENTHRLVGL
jgi:hypothetical protein